MRKRRTPEQWQTLIEQQLDSGLSAARFCNQHDIGYASFCSWRKRLFATTAPEFAEAEFFELSSLMAGDTGSGSAWNIVLSLGNGIELRLIQSR